MDTCQIPTLVEELSSDFDAQSVTEEVIKDVAEVIHQVGSFFDKEDNLYYGFGITLCSVTIPCLGWWWCNVRNVELECWCCGAKSNICVKKRNKWECTHCDQFNGFTEDGDIDQSAEAEIRGVDRFNERQSVYCQRQDGPPRHNGSAPRLCQRCENNAAYKIRALKNFVPTCEEQYDMELEQFERRVEQSCAPCMTCQRMVDRYLAQQTSQMPVPPRPESTRSASMMDSIISSRRSIKSTQRFSKLAISRAIILVYLFLIISVFGSLINADWTLGATSLTFGGYVLFSLIIGRNLPSFPVSIFYIFVLRHKISNLVSVNFEVPKFLPELFEYFNKLDELKIQIGVFTISLQFAILCLVGKRMSRDFKKIAARQTARVNPLATVKKATPSPKRNISPPKRRSPAFNAPSTASRVRLTDLMGDCNFSQATPRVQNPFVRSSSVTQHYATPPPSFASMRSSTSTQPSILRQSRLNWLKTETRSGTTRTPEPQMDEISPFDSVSNYDETEEPMETSFGQNQKANTSFGSDVGSILSATLNTSVQVASNACKWIMVFAIFANLIFFFLLARKIYEYAPNAHRLKL